MWIVDVDVEVDEEDEGQAIIGRRRGGHEVMGRLSALSQRPRKLSRSRNASRLATWTRAAAGGSPRLVRRTRALRSLASPRKTGIARKRAENEQRAGHTPVVYVLLSSTLLGSGGN